MNGGQVAMAKKFGNGGVVCMDATHGTNPYNFKLVTLLVVDEDHEGFPVAFFYCNREDEVALTGFLTEVRNKCGQITPSAFMSDDAEQYFSVWTAVMGLGPRKLLCSWHVDRAWRGKAIAMDVENQSECYKLVKVLQCTTKVDEFQLLLPQIILKLKSDSTTADFGIYFEKYYGNRPEQWAYCHRLGIGVNTNMHLESLHRVIKYVYMRGIKVQRLDRSLHVLVTLVRDKLFGRIIKLHKGKVTTRNATITDRHKKSVQLSLKNLQCISDGWVVWSNRDCSSCYNITKNTLAQDHQCHLKCSECNACVHAYACTCADNRIRGEMCKHIHLVCRSLIKDEAPNVNSPKPHIPTEIDYEELLSFRAPPELSVLESKRKAALQRLTEAVGQASLQQLEAMEPSIKTIVNLSQISLEDVPNAKKRKSEPANKKMEVQRFTKKKKKDRSRGPLHQPNFFEEEEVIENLLRPTSL